MFNQADKIKIEILDDGLIKMTSDPISTPNHQNAEEFFQNVGRLSGGEVTREKRTDADHHHHHGHTHSHGEEQH